MKQIFTIEVRIKKPTNVKLSILKGVFCQYTIFKSFILKLLRDKYDWFFQEYEKINVDKNGKRYELKYKNGSVVFRIPYIQKFCKQFTIPAALMYSAIDSALEVFTSYKAIEKKWYLQKEELEQRCKELEKDEQKRKELHKLSYKLKKHIESKPGFPRLPQWFENNKFMKALDQTQKLDIDFLKWQGKVLHDVKTVFLNF